MFEEALGYSDEERIGQKWKRFVQDVSQQEFEAQAGRSGLGRGRDGSTQVGNPVSEKNKEVLA